MPPDRAYDAGYASIDPSRRIGTNGSRVDAGSPAWGPATIKLQLGWLSAQLRLNPADQFRWGRHDALCDLLATCEPLPAGSDQSLLSGFSGVWREPR